MHVVFKLDSTSASPQRNEVIYHLHNLLRRLHVFAQPEIKYWKSKNAKWHQTSRKSERLNRNLWPSSVPVLEKRAKTINVCIQRQVCAFSFSLVQYPVFNREINGGRLFFFSFLFFFFLMGERSAALTAVPWQAPMNSGRRSREAAERS